MTPATQSSDGTIAGALSGSARGGPGQGSVHAVRARVANQREMYELPSALAELHVPAEVIVKIERLPSNETKEMDELYLC